MRKKKLKGLKRIDKIINKFLSDEFGLTAKLNTDFEYNRNTHIIGYSLAVTEDADKYFITFCNHLNPNIKADIFILSLMHEIAHHFTQFNFSEYDWEDSNNIKDKISINLGLYPEKASKWYNSYFNLEVEKVATEWGLNYIDTHSQKILDFWNELQPAILRFYKKNGVEIDD